MTARQLQLFDAAPAPARADAPSARLSDAAADGAEDRLAGTARDALGAPVEVVFGRSRRHPVQLERAADRRGGIRYRLRLHAFFRAVPAPVRDDLAAWLRAGRRARKATARLDAWIAAQLEALPPAARRGMTLVAAGAVHDLDAIADLVRADASAGPVRALDALPPIGWGRWPTRPPRRRLQLGAFDVHRRVVRVHPVLDDATVPRPVVEYIVFHELLHCAIGDADGGRPHGPLFRAAERHFAATADACAWIDAATPRLLARVARRVRRR